MSLANDLMYALRCPDDGGELCALPDSLQCRCCERQFRIGAGGNTISMVSREPAPLQNASAHYVSGYREARADHAPGENWALPADANWRLQTRKLRQVAQVEALFGADRDLLCDFSAGPGYYTLAYADRFRRVLHCDLSQASLGNAQAQAQARGIDNVLFIRMDYLRPPFRASLPRVICMDTLIRGPHHEQSVLASIRRSLEPGGTAIVDFHNWWHNPLRRLGWMRQNFGQNRSYAAYELPRLLADAGITSYERIPFYQEFNMDGALRHLASFALPPTRWMYRFTHDAI